MCGNSLAIIRDSGRFVVVDSHARSHVGLPDYEGKSVILHFADLDDLHH